MPRQAFAYIKEAGTVAGSKMAVRLVKAHASRGDLQALSNAISIRRDQTVFLIKWFSSIIQILGYTATSFGLTPINIYLFFIGLIGWFAVGLLWNDRAIMLIHSVALSVMIAGQIN